MEAATARCAGCGNPRVGGQPPQAGAFRPGVPDLRADHGPLPRNGPARDRHPQRGSRPRSVALPGMTTKAREKAERQQRKQARPLARSERPEAGRKRALRREDGENAARRAPASRPARGPQPSAERKGASRALRLPSGPARATAAAPEQAARRASGQRAGRQAGGPQAAGQAAAETGRRRYASGLPPLSGKRPGKAPFGAFFMPGNRCLNGRPHTRRW